ncbi:MAG TPA: DUF2121 domain-containing protein [Methanomicrobiales archaeon]|nr:DUF2121 domain-containing protein [Methanomicrobiales archaeon]
MSLVIAFIGSSGAAMAGDMREISFLGNDSRIENLESELYTGYIRTDEELKRRATALGVEIRVRDDKTKVREMGGVLIGEVTAVDFGIVRRRRLYASVDAYAITEGEDEKFTLTAKGRGSNFVVLGNAISKDIAHRCIREQWKAGTLEDAIRVLMLSMDAASRVTASVSKNYVLVQTTRKADLPV